MVLQVSTVDFSVFKLKLQEMADKEKRAQISKNNPLSDDDGFAGEGKPGLFDPNEPHPVQSLRARMRVLHHTISTENTYAGWISRLVKHLDDENLEKYVEDALGGVLNRTVATS